MKKLYFSIILILALVSISKAQVVINEVYGGGGNTGATYTHDFVELYNKGTVAVDLTGWILRYTSVGATATWPGSTSNSYTVLSGTIPANGYFLIQMAKGSGGTVALPTPDLVGATAMSGSGGRVVLTNDANAPTTANTVDLLGWGGTATSNTFYEVAAAPSTTNLQSVSRNATHDDTNNNSADFTAGPPTPQNSLGETTAPVNMLSFDLTKQDKSVKLIWTSAQEKNAKEYVVERSANGKDNWQTIATVAAKGNTSTPTDYTYTDANPLGGTNFYRLKMVDLDGTYEYYKTVSINIAANINVKLYPNPAKDILYIDAKENLNDLHVDIFAASGTRVLSVKSGSTSVDISRLQAGVYFVKITKKGGATEVTKFIKM